MEELSSDQLKEAAMTFAESLRQEGLKKGIQQGITQGLEQGMQQGITQGLEQGMQQGITQGLEKGMQEGMEKGREAEKQALARKLLSEQLEITLIHRVTGLPIATIEALKGDMTTV